LAKSGITEAVFFLRSGNIREKGKAARDEKKMRSYNRPRKLCSSKECAAGD
jgi:hypothetical protein